MSRFGIRKKLKSLVGGAERRVEGLPVTFVLPKGGEHTVEAEERYTLVMASQTLETPIATGCPDGHCGECVVDVLGGGDALAPPTDKELGSFEHGQKRKPKPNERLACHARVQGAGARIQIRRVWTMDSTR